MLCYGFATLISNVVSLLFSGGDSQYILTKAVELNNDQETIKSKFYSLYDKILNYFTITFVIEHHQRPLLLVEIKPPSDFHAESGREAAIIQIIKHLGEIGPTYEHLD